MSGDIDIKGLNISIQKMKKNVKDIKDSGEMIPAVLKNIDRIEASIKMLEMNISDIAELDKTD